MGLAVIHRLWRWIMGRSCSLDLRSRVVAFVEAGHSRRAAARHFGVSESFAITLLRRVARSGSPMLARQGRAPGYGQLVPYAGFLVAAVEREPNITMQGRLAAARRCSAVS